MTNPRSFTIIAMHSDSSVFSNLNLRQSFSMSIIIQREEFSWEQKLDRQNWNERKHSRSCGWSLPTDDGNHLFHCECSGDLHWGLHGAKQFPDQPTRVRCLRWVIPVFQWPESQWTMTRQQTNEIKFYARWNDHTIEGESLIQRVGVLREAYWNVVHLAK